MTFSRSRPLVDFGRAAVSGILLASCFAPTKIAPLAFVALVPLLQSLDDTARPGEGFRRAFVAGVFFFLPLLWWIAILDSPQLTVPWIRLPAMFGVVVFLSLYWGLFGAFYSGVRSRVKLPGFVLAPPLWLFVELIRGSGELGFPWGEVGYSQVPFLPTLQMASVFGIHGVTFWILVVNGLLVEGAKSATPRRRLVTGLAAASLIAGPTLWGAVRLARGIPQEAQKLRVALVQPNLRNDEKWDPETRHRIFEQLFELSREGRAAGARLVLWAETAAPCYLFKDQTWEPAVSTFVRELGVPLFFGLPDYQIDADKNITYSNSAALYLPTSGYEASMSKIRLVPFGEYVPFSSHFEILQRVDFGEADFSPGKEYVVFSAGSARFGNLVCFEAVFPQLARRYVREGANLLVSITNDSWFGAGSGAEQHAEMAVARCVETGRAMARCANSGISLGVDALGRRSGDTPLFTETCAVIDVALLEGRTPYVRWGDSIVFGLAGLWGLAGVFLAFSRRGGRSAPRILA